MAIVIKKVVVDTEVRIEVWKDGKFLEDADVNSQFSEKQARDYFKEKYL